MAAREAAAAALRAQATEIRLDLLPEAAGRVSVDGHPADSATLHVVADTVIEIAGIGRILVRPVIADAAALRDRLAKSEATLSAALARLGLDDVTAAEAQFAAWQATQTELDAAQARLASQVPGDAAAGLAPGIAALQAWVDVQARILADAHDAEAPTVELAEALLAAATRDSRAATEAEAAQGAALNQARLALNTASGRAEQAANEVGRLRREAEQAAARETDEALASREEAGNERLQRAAEELRAVRAAQPEESVDALAARIRRLEQGRAARQEERAATDLRIAELRTRIAASGGEGLEEQIAEAERLEEVLRADRAAIESELAVLTYLRDALQQAERAARQHFLAPVAQHMAPYLHRLFPGAGIECDEAFAITHITRGGGAEEFKTLSDGTQEQIAVLTRLAFADLLIERGSPAMVILDDALAYADADRMERMFDVLAQAGERMQILVLTCREDLFLRLGGTRLALRDAALVA